MKTLIQKNKGLFVLPLIVLPFITLIFYILGGGSGKQVKKMHLASDGANYQLPDADRQIAILDKKEAYEQLPEQQGEKTIKLNVDTSQQLTPLEIAEHSSQVDVNTILLAHVKKQEELSRAALNQALTKPEVTKTQKSPGSNNLNSSLPRHRPQVQQRKTTPKKKTDNAEVFISSPEYSAAHQPYKNLTGIEELDELLTEHEKLLNQNDSLQHQLQQANHILKHYQEKEKHTFKVSIQSQSRFNRPGNKNSLMRAQVVEDSKVLTGNRIRLRLINGIQINGQAIKAGTFIYGLCKTNNERLQVLISSIPTQNNYLPVNLCAYDLDGIKGIYVPDHVARKVYQDVAGDINPAMLLAPANNPISYMGLNAANDLSRSMMKSVRQKKVFLRKNTVVILKNE
ncbi:conjugative transposon protein TraM [Carboxylicivirga marina]|uniref:Conjugative transposon protein TraM n=1 Tax=Carboxylicivirga marina TaxID=2800988 RepID=A0ABS1HKR8_9BACT|nr:conjugative transposon protein TraM [Carboxylicivirga marina]MBK3518262.1 conjugative transposon protein TraM [Carboxylicivirga marina]